MCPELSGTGVSLVEKRFERSTEWECVCGLMKKPSAGRVMTSFAFSDEDIAILRNILAELEPREFDAMTRFYSLGQDSAQILRELGMNISHFQDLKLRIRTAYLASSRPN